MQTEEAELLALAETAPSKAKDLTALVLDLSAIPHIGDPIFFRTLIARLQQAPDDKDFQLYRLSHHIVAIVTPAAQARKTEQRIEHLVDLLKRSGRGGARHHKFSLQSESGKVVRLCKRLMEERGRAGNKPSADDELSVFMKVFASLRQADISNLVREQIIWDLSKPHAPTKLASALTVSIDALDEMFGQDIRSNPWLFDKIFEVIDIRMLDHLVDDRMKTKRRFTVNVNSVAVNEGELGAAFDAIPLTARGRVVLELPYVEALDDQDGFERMRQDLKHQHFPLALDGIRWTSLGRLEVPHESFDYVKIMWDAQLRDSTPEDWKAFSDAVGRIGPERCIMFNCLDETAVEPLQNLGITLFQGRGVDGYVRHDRAEQLHHEQRQNAKREDLADETGEAPPKHGILGKLFG